MYAIVNVAGKQVKVEAGKKLMVPRLGVEGGSEVVFDRVLYLKDDSKVQIGKPYLEKIKVKATVLEHGKDKKVIVFKKKRRKGYKVKRGHRQPYSLIQVLEITTGGKKRATRKKSKVEKKAEEVPAEGTPKEQE